VHSVLPPTIRSRGNRRTVAVRVVCVLIAVAALAGIVFSGPFSAKAAVDVDSSLTVSWAGDTSSAASLQPDRSTSGFEYNEFKNIKVTVEQTKNLIDQAVRVDVSGFDGGTQSAADGTGQIWSTATNFVQAMECWGDPSSPTFRQTCEWGGRFANNNGLGFSVYGDNVYRIAAQDVSPTAVNPVDNPFVARDGEIFSARQELDSSNNKAYPIAEEFGVDSSNEQEGARIKDDGTGSFDFEMQTSIEAPHLGCGGSASTLNCYLVLVPRGSVYGGHDASCSAIYSPGGAPYAYGLSPAIQAGSPMNPGCDYWNNRIVVPLQFNPVAGVCAGGAEENVIGSQLLISAIASWQPTLCNTVGVPISFNTNPDSVARAQLLEKKASVAFTSYPITKDELQDPDDQTAFDNTTVAYAPVAIGAAAVSFLADGVNGQIDSLNLSPRLLAKLLTQSYIFSLPTDGNDQGNDDYAQLGATNQTYTYLFQDPDFQALNPNWEDFITNPSLVLPGPADADAIAQIWKWIQSDADARDFLNGKPDPWGMTVNPNYLPAGNPAAHVPQFDPTTGAKLPTQKAVGFSNLDGSPLALATAPINYFPKADESEVPHVLGVETSRYDSIQASPYVDDFVKSAVTAFRANPGAKTGWDPSALKPDGSRGDWVSGGPQIPGRRFVIAVTDAAATSRYDLDSVGLQAANGTTVTVPTPATMSAAISSGLVATTNPAVKQVDPAKVSSAGYPLTTVVYAAVNLSASSSADRTTIAKMITYVVGDGQTEGTQVGQLPDGYLPLSGDLQSQAKAAATAIAMYTGSTNSPDDGTNIGGSNNFGSGGYGDGSDSGPSGSSSSGPHIVALGTSKERMTPADSSTPFGQLFLGIALIVGLVGAIFAPLVVGLGRS
jgi:hypothetical protein